MQISIDTGNFFYCPKREKFLRCYHEFLLKYKYSEYGKLLTPEQEQQRKEKSLKAIDMANRIYNDRKKAMQSAGVFGLMNSIEKTINKNL